MLNNGKSQDSMDILHSPQHYLFNLHTTNTGQAKRIWRQKIKERWGYKCAYCGSDSELTMDHCHEYQRRLEHGRLDSSGECSLARTVLDARGGISRARTAVA